MARNKQKRPRTYARNRVKRYQEKIYESDSAYFLKLVFYVLLGTLWLKFSHPMTWLGVPITALPVGLLIGLVVVRRFETYQSDRKIWYAVLVVVTIISNFVAAGFVI
jgi:hypothetical protein